MIVDASAFVASMNSAAIARSLRASDVAAPGLLIAETLNAFWKLARGGAPTPDRDLALSLLDGIRIVPTRPHAARAAELSAQFDHPVYHCIYLALAAAEGDVGNGGPNVRRQIQVRQSP